jgi:hypothetical protein
MRVTGDDGNRAMTFPRILQIKAQDSALLLSSNVYQKLAEKCYQMAILLAQNIY